MNRKKTTSNEVGRKEQPILGYRYDEYGKKTLVVKGIEDRYQKAQERLPGVEVKNLIERYTNGDITRLDRVIGTYGDFSTSPTSYMEAMNVVQDATEAFNSLPKDIKESYNNNPAEFIADIGSEKFKRIFKKPTLEPDAELTPITPIKGEIE